MRPTWPAALLAACTLGACATAPRPPAPMARFASPPPSTLPPSPSLDALVDSLPAALPRHAMSVALLPGWAEEDHAAALQAFAATCSISRDPALGAPCRLARALGRLDEPEARTFLEANFRAEPVGDEGLLTAYFTPLYEASPVRAGPFTAPVRRRPEDLAFRAPYDDRAAIESRSCADALAWMRPEDLFFLQIQGSGVLMFDDGRRTKAVFDGANGAPFRGIAAPMREAGLLAADQTSGNQIRLWLAANRGPRAEAMMRLNPRYVFFRLAPDDGADPAGAAGAPLIPGRTVAIDPSRHALGDLLWLDAAAPTLAAAFPAYRRLTVALDTGGAIRGEARADLYLGRGPRAGLEAGRVRHTLRLWRLAPVDPSGS